MKSHLISTQDRTVRGVPSVRQRRAEVMTGPGRHAVR
jgi:hypothetical protein